MDADDDMIVVIVGDGAGGKNNEIIAPIKEKILNGDDVEKLIETAETHGEFIDVLDKEKSVDEDWDNDSDEKYLPDDDIDEDEYGDDDGSGNEPDNRHRHGICEPSQRKSFVKELRDQHPKLKNDNNALILALSDIMRNVKRPLPPKDFFIMNGVMFECVRCGAKSETQSAAGRHYQDKHGERYLVCFACGVDFRSTPNLYRHEKRCSAPDAPVVLKARAAMLLSRGRSRPHLPKHLKKKVSVPKYTREVRKYFCNVCPAAYTSKSYLQAHEMVHRGLRPYICSSCPCAYTSQAGLKRHLKKHDDKRFVCDHCGRVFKIKPAIATHMAVHLPVKKFECDQCEKRYTTRPALTRHIQRKHLPPPCVCKICDKRYPIMYMLKQHMKNAHGLLLLTRRMFYKSLPTLKPSEIEQAKVVLNSEVERDYFYSLQSVPDTVAAKKSDKIMLNSNGDDSTVVSEEVIQYMQSIEEDFDDDETYKVVVIQDCDQR